MTDRNLRRGCLLVGSVMLIFTILDYSAIMWPFELSSLSWRFGAMTTLSGSLVTPAIAVLLLYAGIAGHSRRGQLLLSGGLCGVGLAIMGGWVIFVFDILQLRGGVRPEVLSEYDIAAGRSLIKLGLGALAAFILGVFAFKSSRAMRSAPSPSVRVSAKPPLIRSREKALNEEVSLQSGS